MPQTTLQLPLCQKPTLENSVHYIAHTFSFLATGKDTAGAFSLIHCFFRKGFMAPPHYHKLEDESFYLLEGEIEFHVGDKKFKASAGDFVVLPKNVPHHFDLISETAKALLLITPAGFEVFFREFGRPAQTLELPPVPTENPRKEMFEEMHKRMIELGNVFMPEI
ncbi:MAG TPA: quercetin 2,3-dioxygenase [Chitinophagaceae bacterium]|nr:quercetin 2,3-dioxygenase [Chitinophagaceae bacterium]